MKQLRSFALATDLDGTFAGGTPAQGRALQHALSAHSATLIYITGRSVESARQLVESAGLPTPEVLIADVGTTVLRALGPRHFDEIELEISARWPGAAAVRACLAAVPGIELQDIHAPRRVSYWIVANRDLRMGQDGRGDYEARRPYDPSLTESAEQFARSVAARVTAALHTLDVDVLLSGNVYLDILPHGVNKGSTLVRVLNELAIDVASCIVAGDSLNDRTLFEIGAAGIVVGNCEPALRAALVRQPEVYCAQGEGAGGILEGLIHFGLLGSAEATAQGHPHAE